MTTIIYHNNALYSDTQVSTIDEYETIIKKTIKEKIFKKGNKVYGTTGLTLLSNFYLNKKIPLFLNKDFLILYGNAVSDSAEVICLDKNKIIAAKIQAKYIKIIGNWYIALLSFKKEYIDLTTVKYVAWGSGADIAIKYIKLGLCPRQIIKLVSKHDDFTNNIVTILKS